MSVYEQVVEAYISGLEDLARTGGDVSKIGSVASIFVSRIDTAIDKRLDKLADKRVADRFRGKVAIANAKIAYARYKALFAGPRWQPLAAAGAKTQRLLWASTSVKNPAFKDTMYVEALIGRDTVDTIPPATMDAFRDHGKATPDVIERDVGRRPCLARRAGAARHLAEGGHGRAGRRRGCNSSRTRSTSCLALSRSAAATCWSAITPGCK